MSDISDFNVNDTTGQGTTDLNTLFGVNQNVGGTPITIRGAVLPSNYAPSGIAPVQPSVQSTLTEVLQGFYGMDPSALANLQQQLWAGGYYASSYYGKTPKPPQFGTPDDDSYAAFKSAAVQAARSGAALPDVLDQALKSNAANGGPGGSGTGTSGGAKTLTHPDDLRAVLRTVAQQVIGRRPDPSLEENFIAAFHNAEAQAGQPDGQGNVIAGPQDVSAIAEQYLQHALPQEAYDNGYLGAFSTFRKMIGGGSGG